MATERGNETRVFIRVAEGDDEAAFAKIGGETTFSYKATTPDYDTSDKDGGSGIYGDATYNISLSGNLKLPDPGLVALEAASKQRPPVVDIKIMKGAVVRFAGNVGVGNFSCDAPLGVATWSADMKNTGTPDTVNLTATA